MALLLVPAALADTQSPVRGSAWAGYQADAGAILAQAQGYDPAFAFAFTFARASIYEVLIPAPGADATRGGVLAAPAIPTLLSARHLSAGSLTMDLAQGATVLLASDPRGLGLDSVPLAMPADPARLVVETLAPLDGAFDEDGGLQANPDPRDLLIASNLKYTVDGIAVEQPFAAHATGDLLAVLGRAPVRATDGQNVYARDLAPSAEGERVLIVQAQGARVDLAATGLTAILQMPEASLGAGAQVLADLQGREFGAQQGASVASDAEGLTLTHDNLLAGGLLGARAGHPGAQDPATGQANAYIPLDATMAAVGALVGGLAVAAALGLAGLWATGKQGLFALLAPLYARLQTDEVLANRTRESIFRHVIEHPGVNVSEVVKEFGLGWGATVYHLRVLERSHLLTANKQGRQVCYFQNGGRYNGQMAGISALRNANAALVARVILTNPGIQQRAICKVTALAQPTVSWHLQRLEEAGLVVSEGAPRKRYCALPALGSLAERGFLNGAAPAALAPTAAAPPAATLAPPA